MASWAPSAFLGVEVNKLSGAGEPGRPRRRSSTDSDIEMMMADGGRSSPLPSPSPVTGSFSGSASNSTGELSGIYFGILNIYTTIPQFIGTMISTVVFAALEPGKSPELAEGAPESEKHDPAAADAGPNAIAVCLFIGAIGAVNAIFATRKLRYL